MTNDPQKQNSGDAKPGHANPGQLNSSDPSIRPATSLPVSQWYRFCPWCADEIDPSKQGAIPFRCPKCRFTNFFGPVSAVGGLIVDSQGSLLMVRRANDPGKGKWGLPGGFVDGNESIETALSREVSEETGLVVTASRYLMSRPNLYDYQGIIGPVIDLFFECEVESTEDLQLERSELCDHGWFPDPTPNLENMAFPSNRIAIEFWMQQS